MSTIRNFPLLLFGLLLILGPAFADAWNKKTRVTFHEPVELPAGVVLPSGDYVFKLLDSPSNRHIVQVFNQDETRLHGTVLAIPKHRAEPAGKTIITFYETPSGAPRFIRSWFYPGDTIGQEFAYPRDRAYRIARATGLNVPIHPVGDKGPVETARPDRSPIPAKEPVQTARVTPPSPDPSAETLDSDSQAPSEAGQIQLPQTASHEALARIVGLSSLAAALALRLLWRQTTGQEQPSGSREPDSFRET
jgi:hypothetical protein